MNRIPDDIIFNIFEYLPNYDIFNMYKINKNFTNVFIEYKTIEMCYNRKHPIVFNCIDNYCYKCNLTLSIICFHEEFKTIRCKHY